MSTLADRRFVWTVDADGDGVAETERYATTARVPDIDHPDGGRPVTVARFDTLDGGSLLLAQGRAGRADHRGPGRFTLSWPIVDEDFLRVAEEDFAKGRLVEVRLDHRWRQLRVTASGLPDRTVTVAAGYLRYNGDTCWLPADTPHVCAAADTVVYVTPAAGALSVASGIAVPSGATQVAAISIAADAVTILSTPSGVPNPRRARITEFTPDPIGAGLTSLHMTLEEVW